MSRLTSGCSSSKSRFATLLLAGVGVLAGCGDETSTGIASTPEVEDSTQETEQTRATEPTEPTEQIATEVVDLLEKPIDEFPSEMYSMRDCTQVLTAPPPPNPDIDIDLIELQLDEMSVESPVIARFRVVAEEAPVTFVPEGLPQEYLAATGAESSEDFQLGYTGVKLETLEVVQGPLTVGEQRNALFLGCWSAGSIALTTQGSEVVVMGYEPEDAVGISGLVRSNMGIIAWFEIDDSNRLLAGADLTQMSSTRYGLLNGLTVEEALAALRDAAAHTAQD